MKTMTTSAKHSLLTRLRGWLVFRLLRWNVVIEVEARHGAFRHRHRQLWTGGLVRVDIPLQRKNGVTDTPMGRVSSEEAKSLIDAFTGIEGEDPFNELRTKRVAALERTHDGKLVCALCGKDMPGAL